jgi:hypothetical protein
MTLTVEYADEVVEVFADKDGIDVLIGSLLPLKERGGHDHLMTPSWAGQELTETKQDPRR